MKFSDLPDLTAMHQSEAEQLCKNIEGIITFKHISNGRYKYSQKRVVRYQINIEDSREELVCEITGFPTLDYENIKK